MTTKSPNIALSEALARIETQNRVITSLQNEVHWYEDLVSNPSFNELDMRLVCATTPREMRMGLIAEMPEQKIYMPKIADQAHCDEKTASRHLRKMSEAGLFSYRKLSDPETGNSRVYLQPLQPLEQPAHIALTRAKEGGSVWQDGKRVKRCKSCASENLATISQVVCMDCGTVQGEKTIKPVNIPHSQSDTEERETTIIVESNLEESPPHSQSDTEDVTEVPCTTVSTVGVSVEHLDQPPEELRLLPIWCCHRAKVPYTPRGRSPQKAKVNDASSWETYEQARAMFDESVHRQWKQPFDGIGLMCDGTFTVIDYDHCIENNQVDATVWQRAAQITSYMETSYSGTGMHCIAWGTIPAGRKRPEGEMYCERRFLTWTGNHIPGTPVTIEHQQAQITDLYDALFPEKEPMLQIERPQPVRDYPSLSDEEILLKAKNARNGSGAKFTALFEGDITGYVTQSEADLALCNMLAYWTDGTVDTIRRLFSMSGLYREKWEREDYQNRTINQALEGWSLRRQKRNIYDV